MCVQSGINQTRHKVFVSYHHDNDQLYRNLFENIFDNHILVSKSVQIGDINPNLDTETIRQKIRDEYLRDSTVTVVLIGTETWKRKHVDWEIGSSIRQTKYNSRSGLLGIFLPVHPCFKSNKYDPSSIPQRLNKNVECGYADLHLWNTNPNKVQGWINTAFNKRLYENPDNSDPLLKINRS